VTSYQVVEDGNVVATVTGGTNHFDVTGLAAGTHALAVQAGNSHGSVSTDGPTTSVVPGLRTPVLTTPSLNLTVPTSIAAAAEFLYSGMNPTQVGLTAAPNPDRAVVLRGTVLDASGAPLPGVAVLVADHAEYGYTNTRADGQYDLAVNGGGTFTLSFEREGMLRAERTVQTPWQDFVHVPDVALIGVDHATAVDFSGASSIQVARASAVQDNSGTRQATVMIASGTTAQMLMPSGQMQDLGTAHIRASEYTVGDIGHAAMPAMLPPTSGYTYAVALSLDESDAAQAKHVFFSKPLAVYLENFLSFDIGTKVPAANYDEDAHAWVASTDGRTVKILSITDGVATLDVDGSGQPASQLFLDALGITTEELMQLGSGMYAAGQALWRIPVPHFSDAWDFNQGIAPPPSHPFGPLAPGGGAIP
jgi:hypothetical protein